MEHVVDYDETQLDVINCEAPLVIAEAKAGAGKTSTAIGKAAAFPHEKFLYICFNKSVQLEAERRFGPNVSCRTTHSLAYAEVGRHYEDRITRRWAYRLFADEMAIARPRIAAVAQAALQAFFSSSDAAPTAAHVDAVAQHWKIDVSEHGHVVDVVRRAWLGMCDLNSHVSIPPDAYLKMWALTEPQLPFPRVILDEAQDTAAVIADLVRRQRAKLLLLGDRWQGIYRFRGAMNAMQDFAEFDGAKVLQMPKTWRFGSRTAAIANEILGRLHGEKTKIVGMGRDEARIRRPIALIARTNSVLFGFAAERRGKGMMWVGGSEAYRLETIMDAHRLRVGQRSEIRDPVMRRYQSWLQYEDDAAASKDAEARILKKVVDAFGSDIPSLIRDIRSNEVHDADEADFILATGHRAKGLTFDYVRVADDFNCLVEAEAELLQFGKLSPATAQEINLLYVAFSRARFRAEMNRETSEWFASKGIVLPGDGPVL